MSHELPPLKDYFKAADQGRLYKAVDPTGRYVKFKYSELVTFSGDWDDVTVNARGHVFDTKTGQCVLRPWSKFFNYQEIYQPTGNTVELTSVGKILMGFPGLAPDITGKFYAMDKLDGSLIIAGMTPEGDLMVTSSGSFESKHAIWARNWLRTNGAGPGRFAKGRTYMFEMIADEDLHPIRYNYEGCVLLGIVDNASGTEIRYGMLKDDPLVIHTGMRVADLVIPPGTKTISEALELVSGLPASKEGIVLTFESGFKVKMKGKEFLALQKLFHSLSPKYLIANFDTDRLQFKPEVMMAIPEEFPELREFASDMRYRIVDGLSRAYGIAYVVANMEMERRDVYALVSSVLKDIPDMGPKLVGIAMDCYGKLQKGEARWEDMARGRDELVKYIARNINNTETKDTEDA